MSCITNTDPERLRNIIQNGGVFFDRPPETAEEIVERIKFVASLMKLEKSDSMEDDDTFYTILGLAVKSRVSELGSASYAGRIIGGKKEAKRIAARPDNIRKRRAGTKIHNVLGQLIDAIYNGVGNVDAIRIEAGKGDFPITGKKFNMVQFAAQKIIDQITDIQNEIDPTKKATIFSEVPILDPVINRGGTMDVFAVFSDKSGAIYDFKTKHSWSRGDRGNWNGKELIDDLLGYNSIQDYELNMTEYARIVMDRFGVTKIRQNRLVPIHARLENKKESERKDFDIKENKFSLIEIGGEFSEFLEQIPIRGEETRYKGLNKLLTRQYSVLTQLTNKLKKSSLTQVERDRLIAKIASHRKTIQKTIVDADISDILLTVKKLIHEAESRLNEPETIDNEANPKFLTDKDLVELLGEVNVYNDIVHNTTTYFDELKEKEPELFEKLSTRVNSISTQIDTAYEHLRIERDRRVLDMVPDFYKQEDGTLGALPTLDFFVSTWNRVSEIDHPIFKAAWSKVQPQLQNVNDKIEVLAKEEEKNRIALFKWAKDHGLSRAQAYGKIINFKTSNLVSTLSPDFWKQVEKAKKAPPEEGIKILQSLYYIEDIDAFKKDYNTRLREYKEKRKFAYDKERNKYMQNIEDWEKNNNLLKYPSAWFNEANRGRLSIRPEVLEQYKSKEYKYVENNKPLLDYYQMYVKYNDIFRDILGLKYKDLPANFIPNIRKDALEYFTKEGFNARKAFSEYLDSFRVREEDVYIGERDEMGNIHKRIPMLWINPLINVDNEVDNTQKSYDLGRNLLLFGRMAYNYAAMNEIEASIQLLKGFMGDPSSETEGTEVTTPTGRAVKGVFSKVATKAGLATEEYKLFEKLFDYYLYGTKYRVKNIGKKFNVIKLLQEVKMYHSKRNLSFALIPAIGALLAGRTAAVFEGKKGTSFTSQGLRRAQKAMLTDTNKFMAFGKYFQTYADMPIDRLAQKASIKNVKRIFSARVLFSFLRKTDEHLVNLTTNAMMHSWGIDEKGNLVNLNNPKFKKKNIKSIYESAEWNEKEESWVIPNMNKEAYLAMRNAIKGTTTNIFGSLSHEDINQSNVNMTLGLMMHYKTWLPGIAREHVGGLVYDERIQSVRWGRMRAVMNEFELTNAEKEAGMKMAGWVTQVLVPTLSRTVLDMLTFGLGHRMGLNRTHYTTDTGEQLEVRGNAERAWRRFIQFTEIDNPHLKGKITFEEFIQTRNGQIKAFLVQMRAITAFLFFLGFMGGDGEGDEPRYMYNRFTRLLHKSLAKTNSELMFMWNPKELTRLMANPIPISSILTDFGKSMKNFVDESGDLIVGENSPYDKSPFGYYAVQWGYGGTQISRVLELYDTYKKTPDY